MYQAARVAPACLALWTFVGCSEGQTVSGSAGDGLVFVRVVEGSGDLMRARLSDGAERTLLGTPAREESWPYWSDAARRLVFETGGTGEGQLHDLVVWDPDSGDEMPLVETPARGEGWAAWAPSAPRVAYAFRGRPGPAGLAVKDLETGVTKVLARSKNAEFFFRPHFAPGGRRMVTQRRGSRGSGSHLWIVAPGARPRPLTRDPAWFDLKGGFTRDGGHVVYSRRPADGGAHEIAIVAADGAGLRRLALPGEEQHSGQPSPTRDELAFVAERNGSLDLFVAELSGEGARALTDTPERNEFAPRWSPDGERLVVTVSPAEHGQPRLVNREGLETTRVVVLDREGRTLLETPGMMPDWMPPWP